MLLPKCVRIDAEDKRSRDALLADGWREIEVLLTLANFNPRYDTPHFNVDVSDGSWLHRDACGQIAVTSFTLDRLHADPMVPPEVAKQFKIEWVKQRFEDRAYEVLVYKKRPENVIAGFILLGPFKADHEYGPESQQVRHGATVDLLAVSNDYRRQRIGTALLETAMARHFWLRAGTQETNEAALKLYGKFGMKPVKRQRTFHK